MKERNSMLDVLLGFSFATFFTCFGFGLAAIFAADKIRFLELRIEILTELLEKDNKDV